ncbi:hypothetical protein SNE35_21855 [Paucibacter sp. R3-3]|uniref:DUF11 domain-containing protein n=1 Tax=Roseateles agri TaxID=3098619 RepID=A0ABU5DLK4_9BURK|nr:hypothetical protein [Paucibacter sp. R3-3]MDY0747167.1 hypothetical protein [Paucibacter sp. R3-3]
MLRWLRRLGVCLALGGWSLAVPAQTPDTVTNSASITPPAGVHDPDCGLPGPADCGGNNSSSTSAPLWVDAVTKSAEPASGTSVQAGQTITYTLTITVANAPTTAPIVLQDQLGTGLAFGGVVSAGPFVAGGSGSTRSFTLPAGAPVGAYAVRYTATVTDGASGKVSNVVSAPGCTAGSCSTTHPLGGVVVAKRLSSESGTQSGLAEFAETLGYTITLTNGDAAPAANYRFNENVPAGATLVGVDGASGFSSPVVGPAAVPLLVAQVPANGVASVAVRFRIADSPPAGLAAIVNRIDGGDIDSTICGARCIVTTPLEQPTAMRLVKSVAVREAHIGDLVRYTLRVANAGAVDIVNGSILDTPPQGFNYVAGSMTVADRDGAFTLGSAQTPLQIGGIDIATGQEAVISYLLRVGAGVRQGVYTNQAQAVDRRGWPISNVATAQVSIVADPLLDESLILGTVFDDRDGDGWQAPAGLSGVRVQGGFAAEAYIAGSTEIDRGQGFVALPDDGAPLLKGLALGRIAGRESEADAPRNHQLVLRQRLRALDFRDGFSLRSAQGVSLLMDAAGITRLEREGDAAKGLDGALPSVERRVAVGEGGYVVDYVLRNLGIDERGIPGVRIASAEGLLMETDAYGRYHLLGIDGGTQAFGRNFVLKVDPATLPADAEFSTPSPLVRRITPGVPVRFDFGVRLPLRREGSAPVPAGILLGEALFEAGQATLNPAHAAVLNELAARLQAQGGGGELLLPVRDDEAGLGLARAHTLRTALLPRLQPAAARAVRVVLRPAGEGPPLAALVQGGVVLGAMCFEPGQAALRPSAAPLLHALAQQLAQDGGGRVEIAQDPGGTPADLAMARARAVYAALAAELPAAVRGRLEVAP